MSGRRSDYLLAAAVSGSLLVLGWRGIHAAAYADHAPGMARSLLVAQSAAACTLSYDKSVAPRVVHLGETVGVTLTARAVCPRVPVHIVMVMDGSASVAGTPSQQMKQVATALIRAIELARHPETRAAVVEFEDVARVRCNLTSSEARLLACVDRLTAVGGSRIDAGIDQAVRVLVQGAADVAPVRPQEVLIVFTNGRNDAGCNPVLRAAAGAKSRNALVVALGIGDCDDECLRALASSPRHWCNLNNTDCGIRGDFLRVRSGSFVITTTLSAEVGYVVDSAQPVPYNRGSDGVFVWRASSYDDGWITISLRVRPLVAGVIRTGASSVGTWTDRDLTQTSWTFPEPEVTVLDPRPRPTQTPTLARPSPTATPFMTLPPPSKHVLFLPLVQSWVRSAAREVFRDAVACLESADARTGERPLIVAQHRSTPSVASRASRPTPPVPCAGRSCQRPIDGA